MDQSFVSPANTSAELMLSISTITSAIADASISADPSQLAAMIMELSRRSKAKGRHGNTGIGGSSVAESTSPLQHVSGKEMEVTGRCTDAECHLLYIVPKSIYKDSDA